MKLTSMPKEKTPRKKDLVPGSRVPVSFLIDYLKEGYTITDFASAYPWIKRSDLEKALDEIKRREFSSQYAI
jgi:uncharacterized protein (DUF433 family)